MTSMSNVQFGSAQAAIKSAAGKAKTVAGDVVAGGKMVGGETAEAVTNPSLAKQKTEQDVKGLIGKLKGLIG